MNYDITSCFDDTLVDRVGWEVPIEQWELFFDDERLSVVGGGGGQK